MISVLGTQLLRTHRKKLILITTLIAFALSLFVSIGLFVSNVNKQILDQTKPLVGADIIIESSQALPTEAKQAINLLTKNTSSQTTDRITFSTNLTLSGAEANLVQVQGIQSNYPLYGTTTIKKTSTKKGGVSVDQQTYDQYVKDGSLRIGKTLFPVTGIIQERSAVSVNIFDEGRIVLVPYEMIQSTQLTQLGSRVSYETLIKVDEIRYDALLKQLQSAPELTGIAQISDGKRRVGQIQSLTDEFDRFITIVLIITFVLVATTIFISIRTFFTNEQRTIGILKILGQRTRDMIWLYGSMFSWCFVVGIIIACGVGLLSIELLKTFPLTEYFVVYPIVLRETVIIGGILAVITITLPLYTVTSTPGLALLRPEELPKKSLMYKQAILLCVGIYCMYIVTLMDWIGGILFLIGFALCVRIFALIVQGLLHLLKKRSALWSHKRYLVYDGIRTSIAPGNQSVLMSIGLCISVISLLVMSGVSSSFLDRLSFFNEDQPSLYVLNILPKDVSYIMETDSNAQLYDVILSRIQAINGVSLQQHMAQKNESGERPGRSFTREFNVTTVAFEKNDYIVGNPPGEGEVSLEEGFAQGLDVGIGDSVSFFIQGRMFVLNVTSLRKEKRTGGPFFFIQFSSQQFESAPKTYFWTVDVDEKKQFKQTLIDALGPHLSFIDTDEIISTVQEITADLILVVRILFTFLLFFVFISIAVCLRAMKTLKQQKIKLYSLLGATESMIKKSLYSEQGAIFGVAFTSGVITAIGLLWFIFSKSELLAFSSTIVIQLTSILVGLVLLVCIMIWRIYRTLRYT